MVTLSKPSLGPGAFRLFLASLVVVQHLSRLSLGHPAVLLFFMLSGYWVCRMYAERYRVAHHGLARFYISRFLRLWPLFALLAVVVGPLVKGYDWAELLRLLPLIGIATTGRDPLGVSWSLDIELQFYLIVPLVVAGLAGRLPLWLFVISGLAMTGVGLWLLDQHRISTALLYLPAFLAGALIWKYDWHPSRRLALFSAVFCGLTVVLAILIPATRDIFIARAHFSGAERLALTGWTMTLLPFIAWNVHQPGGRGDRILGDLSYPVYLVHFPVIAAMKPLWDGNPDVAGKAVILVTAYGISLAIYALVDRPLERWRKRTVGV